MTDSRLQQLKRQWEATQSVEDEAAYLRERVRVGELPEAWLRLLAYLGHEAACTAQRLPVLKWEPGTVSEAIRNLRDLSPQVQALVDEVLEAAQRDSTASFFSRVADLIWTNRSYLCARGLTRAQRFRRKIATRIHDPLDFDYRQREVAQVQSALRERIVPFLLRNESQAV